MPVGPDRRRVLAGLVAAGLSLRPTWADAGSPAYLSAAGLMDGSYVLCGIGAGLDIVFEIALPGRGHAAAAHPSRPDAVAFARRPGTFALVIDCRTGQAKATLSSPPGRHFYGHGTFSRDGDWLFTTENDFAAATGRVGVWDVAAGYVRAGEFASGGCGPHDLKRLADSDVLVVANGGIETHPDTGRSKLNIPTMRPNLAYIKDGSVIELAELPPDLHKNSIRHLAIGSDGQVVFGAQWQGDGPAPFLVGTHRLGGAIEAFSSPPDAVRSMQGYVGSIAFSGDQRIVAATSPRGGIVQTYDATRLVLTDGIARPDASGIAPMGPGLVISSGTGALTPLGQDRVASRPQRLRWDNHLIAL